MIKIILTKIIVLCAVSAFSQSTFGIRGGLNLASEYVREDKKSSTTKIAPSFHLTGYYDARISPAFSIQPGISLQGKGAKSDVDGQTFTDKLLYIEVPVNFLGRVPAGNGEMFFGGGPYLAYGVRARLSSGRTSRHLNFGSGPSDLRPFDAGVGFMVGYRFVKGVVLGVSGSAGFVNMGNVDGMTFQNRVTSFSVGYEFGKR